jgi:hypothetical protein
MEPGEYERVKVFRFFGAGNYATREDVLLLIAFVRGVIKQDPDIDPAVRLLGFIQLGPIDREHEYGITFFNFPRLARVQILFPMKDIFIDVGNPICHAYSLQNFLCALLMPAHLFCVIGMPP